MRNRNCLMNLIQFLLMWCSIQWTNLSFDKNLCVSKVSQNWSYIKIAAAEHQFETSYQIPFDSICDVAKSSYYVLENFVDVKNNEETFTLFHLFVFLIWYFYFIFFYYYYLICSILHLIISLRRSIKMSIFNIYQWVTVQIHNHFSLQHCQ